MPDSLQFFYKSANAAPGAGVGDEVADPKAYAELAAISGWRQILANYAVTPFTWKGKRWNTAEHAYQAARIETLNPGLYETLSLDSGSEVSKGSGEVAKAQAPVLPKAQNLAWAEGADAVWKEIWQEKFATDERAGRILRLTGDAALWYATPKAARVRWTGLEDVRAGQGQQVQVQGQQVQVQGQQVQVQGQASDVAQRNRTVTPEMEPAPTPKSRKKTTNSKNSASASAAAPAASSAAAPAASPAPTTVTSVPANSLASVSSQPAASVASDAPAEQKDSGIHFCQQCSNYMYLQVDGESQKLFRLCRNCGFKSEPSQGGLVTEMVVQQRSAEGFNMINEFTLRDPRLPHIHKIMKCINPQCSTNVGSEESDIVYIKYDLVNLRYIYMCYSCETVWRSRR